MRLGLSGYLRQLVYCYTKCGITSIEWSVLDLKTGIKIMMEIFNYNTAPGATIYTILIVAFTFFYAFVQVNPEKLAENLQKQGSYIPSVRPGKGTEEYVSSLLMRLSTVGAIFLGLVALLPIIAQMVWNLPQSIGLGGTSLLIVIGVALETAKQLEGLMLKRKYVGFIELSKKAC